MASAKRLEIVRFGLVGVVNTAVDFGVFLFLYRIVGFDPLAANTIAFLVAVSNSYLMNHRWTFRKTSDTLSFSAYARFVALNTGGLLIGTLAIVTLGKLMPVELAKLIATGLTLVWNFTTSKLFVFKEDKP